MKKQPKSVKMEQSDTYQQLEANLSLQLKEAQAQASQLQAVAQETVNRLVYIESRLSPQLLRKPNIINILFHWKEVMNIIGEIVLLIKEFKDLIQKPQQPNDASK
jgi:hypothetical protein